ncbi:MAG TPA: hypothetical protein VGO62_04630 [Myxococcota bacterium]|jgi:hypothetical protein
MALPRPSDDGLKTLEAAVRHHADELSPSMRVQLSLAVAARWGSFALGALALALAVMWLDNNARASVPVLLTIGAMGGTLLWLVGTRKLRLAMARAALRDVERSRTTAGVGLASAVSSSVSPALLFPHAPPAHKAKQSRPRKVAAADKDAVDFDDAA